MCFLSTLDKDGPREEFDLIKKTMNYIIQEYGYQSASYCEILRKNNKLICDMNFETSCSGEATLHNRIVELEQPSSPALLSEYLEAVYRVFRTPNVREEAKKVRYVRVRLISAALSSSVSQQGRVGSLFNHYLVIGPC